MKYGSHLLTMFGITLIVSFFLMLMAIPIHSSGYTTEMYTFIGFGVLVFLGSFILLIMHNTFTWGDTNTIDILRYDKHWMIYFSVLAGASFAFAFTAFTGSIMDTGINIYTFLSFLPFIVFTIIAVVYIFKYFNKKHKYGIVENDYPSGQKRDYAQGGADAKHLDGVLVHNERGITQGQFGDLKSVNLPQQDIQAKRDFYSRYGRLPWNKRELENFKTHLYIPLVNSQMSDDELFNFETQKSDNIPFETQSQMRLSPPVLPPRSNLFANSSEIPYTPEEQQQTQRSREEHMELNREINKELHETKQSLKAINRRLEELSELNLKEQIKHHADQKWNESLTPEERANHDRQLQNFKRLQSEMNNLRRQMPSLYNTSNTLEDYFSEPSGENHYEPDINDIDNPRGYYS